MSWKNGIHIPPKGFKSPYGPRAAQEKKLRKTASLHGGSVRYSNVLKTNVARKNAWINGHEVRTLMADDGSRMVTVFIDDFMATMPVEEVDGYIARHTQ